MAAGSVPDHLGEKSVLAEELRHAIEPLLVREVSEPDLGLGALAAKTIGEELLEQGAVTGIEQIGRELAQQLAIAPGKEGVALLGQTVADARPARPRTEQPRTFHQPLGHQRLQVAAHGLGGELERAFELGQRRLAAPFERLEQRTLTVADPRRGDAASEAQVGFRSQSIRITEAILLLTRRFVKIKVIAIMTTRRNSRRERPAAPALEGPIYPRFFLAGIAVTLTAGAGWGAWLLLRIARARDFAAPSIFEVNAHGQAQIYGWMGLFILGFALQMFPAFWGTRLPAPRLARALLPTMALAVAVRVVAEGRPEGRFADLAVAAGYLELVVVVAFVTLLGIAARRSTVRGRAADRYLGAGLVWFVLASALDLRHLARTVGAPDRESLLAEIATWQLPLRDLQIHGLALSMILGVSLRVLPGFFGTPVADETRARRLFWPLQLAVLAEAALFPLAMTTKRPLLFVAFWIATVVFALAAALAAANLRVFARCRLELPRISPVAFVRAAHVWLGVSLLLLVAGPLWSRLLGLPFSHAWHGATRHAITVGFVSLMMIGVASRIAPRPAGSGTAGAALPWTPFVLLNLGCALRVSQQILTDITPVAFLPTGVSGLLEVAGLTTWAIWIVPRLRRAGRVMEEARAALTSEPLPASGAPRNDFRHEGV